MPRTCTICGHPDRMAINEALLRGEPYRNIGMRTGTSVGALTRHKKHHIPTTLAKATEAREIAHADTLLDQVQGLQAQTQRILDKAEKAGDLRTAASIIGQLRGVMELEAKMMGELSGPSGGPLIKMGPNILELPDISGPGTEDHTPVVTVYLQDDY